jgi:serine protease Do
MFKKGMKIILIVLMVVILSGFFAVFFDRLVMPWASSFDSLAKYKFFQKLNERVTVINKTEQVTVKEDFSVTKTAENVLPTVVSIITFQEQANQEEVSALIKSSRDIEKNIKTGIILTSDGLIVSVVDDLFKEEVEKGKFDNKYKVLIADGKEFDAELKAYDDFTNLVFYKIDTTNLAVPNFGNSDELESGEKLVVCGNATGEYQNTFSLGIIRFKDRFFSLLNSELSSSEKIEGAIIADAQIDNSNIGGPAVDFNGDLVGIANRIEKDGKEVGFVMPINNLKNVIDQVIKNGKIDRPYLGAYYLSINREIALLNNLSVNQGALIYSFSGQQGLAVIKNSPADKAGLKLGDIVIAVDETEVNASNSFSEILSQHKAGDEITLKILREGKQKSLKVGLE